MVDYHSNKAIYRKRTKALFQQFVHWFEIAEIFIINQTKRLRKDLRDSVFLTLCPNKSNPSAYLLKRVTYILFEY